jgi:hypothetical protein
MSVGVAWAQDVCLRPTPVPSLNHIKTHTLALESSFGPAFVGEACSRLDHDGRFGGMIKFFLLPPKSDDVGPAYVLIKSYRAFAKPTQDKIKMSRGGGWHTEKSTSGKPDYMSPPQLRNRPFRGSVAQWNEAHTSGVMPEAMTNKLGQPFHAYADSDKALPSTEPAAFWQTGDFDFSKGTQTNYVIRFPANSSTPIPFEVGYDENLTEFRLEFYSSIDALSEKSYTFVFR